LQFIRGLCLAHFIHTVCQRNILKIELIIKKKLLRIMVRIRFM
jgi:hypothetical protein